MLASLEAGGLSTINALRTKLVHGAGGALVVNIAGLGLTFLAQLVLARVLGAASYGIYVYVFTWVTFLTLAATLGFQPTVLRLASAYCSREQWRLARGVVRFSERSVVLVGLAIGGIGFVWVYSIADRIAEELRQTLLIGFFVVPTSGLLLIRSSVARAYGRVAGALAPLVPVREAALLSTVGLAALFLHIAVHAPFAMAVTLAATCLGLMMITTVTWRARPKALANERASETEFGWLRIALSMLFMTGANTVLDRGSIVMLGWLGDPAAAGVYAVAARAAWLIGLPHEAIGLVVAPMIAALYAQGDRERLRAVVIQATRWSGLAAVVIALPLFAWSKLALSLFGIGFSEGSAALRLLLPGYVIYAAFGPLSWLLLMTGHERQAGAILAVGATVNIGLNAVLIPLYGSAGAAAATAIAWTGSIALMAFYAAARFRSCPIPSAAFRERVAPAV